MTCEEPTKVVDSLEINEEQELTPYSVERSVDYLEHEQTVAALADLQEENHHLKCQVKEHLQYIANLENSVRQLERLELENFRLLQCHKVQLDTDLLPFIVGDTKEEIQEKINLALKVQDKIQYHKKAESLYYFLQEAPTDNDSSQIHPELLFKKLKG